MHSSRLAPFSLSFSVSFSSRYLVATDMLITPTSSLFPGLRPLMILHSFGSYAKEPRSCIIVAAVLPFLLSTGWRREKCARRRRINVFRNIHRDDDIFALVMRSLLSRDFLRHDERQLCRRCLALFENIAVLHTSLALRRDEEVAN